jgi:O-succinylbenzoate synthase
VKADPVYVWPYLLRSAQVLNARSSQMEHQGALLRIGGGVACLHPWPDLGDPPLDALLEMLREGADHPLLRRARACAMIDRAARLEGRSCFDGLTVPLSYASVPGWSGAEIESARRHGFTAVKLKAGRDVAREAEQLNEFVQSWPELRWRLDFNAAVSFGEVRIFLECLRESTIERIDYLEDPCAFREDHWLALRELSGVRLAMDRDVSPQHREPDVLVIKPVVVDPAGFHRAAAENAQWLVVTSSMDHPVGQAYAAFEAGRLSAGAVNYVAVCGLQTHGLFEPDAFTERLGPVKPGFQPPGGTGLGFDELLEGLEWRKLA